jgi:hypothetical protein
MSTLEYFGINVENIQDKINATFELTDQYFITRSARYTSSEDVLISYRSMNNDMPLGAIANMVGTELNVVVDEESNSGEFLIV